MRSSNGVIVMKRKVGESDRPNSKRKKSDNVGGGGGKSLGTDRSLCSIKIRIPYSV